MGKEVVKREGGKTGNGKTTQHRNHQPTKSKRIKMGTGVLNDLSRGRNNRKRTGLENKQRQTNLINLKLVENKNNQI